MEANTLLHMTEEKISFDDFTQTVIHDYYMAYLSRCVSLLGRKEVLSGKAKFGVFGDGLEVTQIAMAKQFQPGDFRAGYYRDQTFMFASELATPKDFFAQLYADHQFDPFSHGRQMNSHFSTPFIDKEGNWLPLVNTKNISSDVSPTAGQMPRALGLAFASKCFRNTPELASYTTLSNHGNEICFCTIGDASTSEGVFFETLQSAAIHQVPLAVFVYDNGYGISVPKHLQTIKSSISEALKGFQKEKNTNGIDIYTVKAWDYAAQCALFETALQKVRKEHIPALFHIEEVTQPQGHSTSGSHERYKDATRLHWEREWDSIKKMKEWILMNALTTEETLEAIEHKAKKQATEEKNAAWQQFNTPLLQQKKVVLDLIKSTCSSQLNKMPSELSEKIIALSKNNEPIEKDFIQLLYQVIYQYPSISAPLEEMYQSITNNCKPIYNRFTHQENKKAIQHIQAVPATYDINAPLLNGFEILNSYFDTLFKNNPLVFAFGEDVGKIGDVNQGFMGLQKKYSTNRIFDTGICENAIVGKALGMAMRGLRPIAEIQYLDYMFYPMQTLVDDVATLHYRSAGTQTAPLIIRTRGHRLEGIWHSGSYISPLIHSLRGMHICVPRNMVQAIGMYNCLLKGNDPGMIIECLNGYRLKEQLPNNLLSLTIPLGVPEIIQEGSDITIVSYGSILHIIEEAIHQLKQQNISCELIDVQTLLPFDTQHIILQSLKKTNRILFIDEDMDHATTAYMFAEVLEKQGGFKWLDATPRTLSSQPHRPAYGNNGDYFSKPNLESIINMIQLVVKE